jgi:hypothetical protein
MEQVSCNTTNVTETENLYTMGEEELAYANYNLIEALKFFDDGSESGMFKIKKKKTGEQDSDLIVTLRKHNMTQNG